MTGKRGLLAPLRRGARDFEVAADQTLLLSKVKQVLCTEPGELPWRTRYGAGLGRLRHQNNDAVLRELARVSTRDALARWMPGTVVGQLDVRQEEGSLVIALSVSEPRSASEGAVEVRP
jgi:phage baseplate assembly protein W